MTESAEERAAAHLRAVEAVRERACGLLDYDQELSTPSYADRYRKFVFIAIARHHGSIVLAVDAAEYNWLDVAQLSGLLPRIDVSRELDKAA